MPNKNPHLLLLPGLLNDARLWQHQVSVLSRLAQTTVADLRGKTPYRSLLPVCCPKRLPGALRWPVFRWEGT
ncbi:hypothetical protein [Chitinimonas sp. BJB300]|uniref:hypothetical protein n=1 Tax=Chitinimonas sp. BJB300 TaxID=1559339 RepID=UPI001C91B297|nr:hypothetical protein [Chitinimonas sp. BJB300]